MVARATCIIILYFTLANAGVLPVPSSNILEGPSTRTKVIGPDGSIIDAYAPGGKIILEDNAGPLLQPAPLVLAHPAIDESHTYSFFKPQSIVLSEPLANTVEVLVPIQHVEANSINVARISEDGEKVLLHPGTPPRVETRESVPVKEETDETFTSTTDLPATTEEVQTSTPDLSGAYVQDNLEKLYDDGSYRQEHY